MGCCFIAHRCWLGPTVYADVWKWSPVSGFWTWYGGNTFTFGSAGPPAVEVNCFSQPCRVLMHSSLDDQGASYWPQARTLFGYAADPRCFTSSSCYLFVYGGQGLGGNLMADMWYDAETQRCLVSTWCDDCLVFQALQCVVAKMGIHHWNDEHRRRSVGSVGAAGRAKPVEHTVGCRCLHPDSVHCVRLCVCLHAVARGLAVRWSPTASTSSRLAALTKTAAFTMTCAVFVCLYRIVLLRAGVPARAELSCQHLSQSRGHD